MRLQRHPEPSAGRQASTAPAAPGPCRDSAPGCGLRCRCLRWSSPAFLAAPRTSRDGSSVSPSLVGHSPEEAQVSERFRDYSLLATSIAVPQRLQIWSFSKPQLPPPACADKTTASIDGVRNRSSPTVFAVRSQYCAPKHPTHETTAAAA